MIAPVDFVATLTTHAQLEAAFRSILPIVERHAKIYFRHVKCMDRKGDLVAEAVALSWKWFLALARRGKDATAFPTTLATYAARAVCCGRRLCGTLPAKDVMSVRAQRRFGFCVESLPASTRTSVENLHSVVHGQRELDAMEERLRDNTQTPVPDQVAFRADFPAWLRTLTERDRWIIQDMMRNERTKDLARKYRLTCGRISQMRRAFHEDWERFCAAPTEECTSIPA